MQEKPKPDEAEDPDAWAEDQKDREYYYDDAHGYEEYEPGAEEGDDDNEQPGQPAAPKERPQADLPDLRISSR